MKVSLKRFVTMLSVAAVVAVGAVGCGRQQEVLQIKGSDTMVNLAQALAEAHMQQQPGSQVAVTGGGSGTGIAALINGTTHLALASRDIKPAERDQLKQKGKETVEVIIARDGLSVIVHPANTIGTLTFPQLASIFTGAVTNWREVGGPDMPIIVMSRESSSGTHVFFREHVMGNKDYAASAMLLPSSNAIVTGVAADRGAIGYVGIAYVNASVKAVAVADKAGSPAVYPTEEAAKAGTYPLTRPLFIYAASKPAGLAKGFLDFVLSAAGQKLVLEQGFVPVR